LEAPGQDLAVVDDVDLEDPHEGEVLVEIDHCGVCHSDLHFVDGTLPAATPAVLGHEAGGTIQQVGPGVTGLAVGDKVILTLRPPCGRCYWCIRGEFSICQQGAALSAGVLADGGTRLSRAGSAVFRAGVVLAAFAEHTVVPANAAVKVPEDTPLDVASVLGCAVQTGVGAVVNTAKVEEGATVLIVGLGGIGVSIAQGARLAAASTVIGVDPVAERREQALRFGVTHAVGPDDLETTVQDLTGGVGVDYAFDAVGRSGLSEACLGAIRNGGTAVIVGVAPIADQLTLSPLMVGMTERKLMGCFLGSANPHRDFPRLLALWKAGRLDLEGMVTGRRPLAEINDAFADMKAGKGLRTLIQP
jgi:Zn-dependent alcohol dehydrogenase